MSEQSPNRRDFIKKTSAGAVGAAVAFHSSANARESRDSNEKLRIGFIGPGGRGFQGHVSSLSTLVVEGQPIELVAVCDCDKAAAEKAVAAHAGNGPVAIHADGEFLKSADDYDVLVEATNSIGFAAEVCETALRQAKHVVLMNAEVDLALGLWLHQLAKENNVVLTSDAGDQHGVLMRMIDEIRLWDFRVVMAGNMKGFLNRYATAESLEHEARIRRLNPIQCCAYTDGTKLNVEMALISNATGMVPSKIGMEGPVAERVEEVLAKFDFDKYPAEGVVDYVLGAQPGGGVYVVGHCDDPFQVPYLSYYKLGDGPFYLFYRPYHLCHIETPWAIASAVLDNEPLLAPTAGRVADVYAYAKRDLVAGDEIKHAIGGDECYGMIDRCSRADGDDQVPLALLETEGEDRSHLPKLKTAVKRDEPLRWSDLDVHANALTSKFHQHIRPLPCL